ncbi:MAG: ExbD/TolR family protein [Opitutaceae bacterium]
MSALMNRPRKRPELNLVPLIDVLVMLIFFAFVTMQFKSVTTLNITLPKIETAGKNDIKNGIIIGIDKQGALFLNGKQLTDDQLESALVQVHNQAPDVPIVIKGDEKGQIGRLTFVMDACRSNGLSNLTIQSRD